MTDARLAESSDISEPENGGGGNAPGDSWSGSGRGFSERLSSVSICGDLGEVPRAGDCFASSSLMIMSVTRETVRNRN